MLHMPQAVLDFQVLQYLEQCNLSASSWGMCSNFLQDSPGHPLLLKMSTRAPAIEQSSSVLTWPLSKTYWPLHRNLAMVLNARSVIRTDICIVVHSLASSIICSNLQTGIHQLSAVLHDL